ncbi:MAG: hypothetical protein AVDCRST_MAG45-481, partial [uncultured Solirubrobacterales bacterium]
EANARVHRADHRAHAHARRRHRLCRAVRLPARADFRLRQSDQYERFGGRAGDRDGVHAQLRAQPQGSAPTRHPLASPELVELEVPRHRPLLGLQPPGLRPRDLLLHQAGRLRAGLLGRGREHRLGLRLPRIGAKHHARLALLHPAPREHPQVALPRQGHRSRQGSVQGLLERPGVDHAVRVSLL